MLKWEISNKDDTILPSITTIIKIARPTINLVQRSHLDERTRLLMLNTRAIVFCFDNCAAKSEDKFVLVRLKCCPSYRSRKKGIEGKFFEAEAVGRG